uniref:Uncharacterized protein n=1 Tax=Podoviridae sp. ct8Lf7 TaxID=2827723 RepID=A0A8S5S0B7_9CAUD|nr:MAG TPA: hypothetical protein [Podoviridae sp. ct8Lf7]
MQASNVSNDMVVSLVCLGCQSVSYFSLSSFLIQSGLQSGDVSNSVIMNFVCFTI